MAIKAESLQDAIRELRGEIAVLSAGLSVPGQDADALLQRAQKAAAGFARDAVLHEICTFEEILIHSVPRIEGTDAALCLTQAHTELIMILKKNGIEAIRPEPHQAWNAREHEVLIAEEAEGFQRGEIIKCMGTGFRTGADILVRANVLVAK
jgi:molecular chaperone GrpE (heat shock protein)